jgi:hypothetical protein
MAASEAVTQKSPKPTRRETIGDPFRWTKNKASLQLELQRGLEHLSAPWPQLGLIVARLTRLFAEL